MTMVEPSAFSACSIFITSSPWAVSRLPVGSSARISFGAATRARATATRCCWPPDNWRRAVLGAVGDAHLVHHLVDPGAPLARGDVVVEQRKLDILADGKLVDEIEATGR